MTVIRPSYADVARRIVRRLRGEPPPRLPADRRRLVAVVEQALHARARRRARTRAAFAGAGVAAAAAVALFVLSPRLWRGAPADTSVNQRAPEPLAAPANLVEGQAAPAAVAPVEAAAPNKPTAVTARAATVAGSRISRRFAGVRAGERRHEEPAAAARSAPAAPVSPVTQPRTSASDLAAQNDLFAAAVRAKKGGQLQEAARLFGKLMDEHPRGPLVESAAVQRMKLLAALDPAAGARAARDYLTRFPGGFARPDAEALASRSAP